MKELRLNATHVAVVDDADFEMLSHWKWTWEGRYAIRRETRGGKPRVCYMHRMIMLPDAGQPVDHVNGNKLDNRRRNLRVVNMSENQANSKSRAGSSSRFKGVSWHSARRQWRAYIGTDGSCVHLGMFLSESDAARAYDRAALRLFGEYARLNFPEVAE
jgi:hypothetical protein